MAHGTPGERVIVAGDVVNSDVSAELDGYFADAGATRVVPPVSPLKQRLCDATRCALESALTLAREAGDGWTLAAAAGGVSAQFEHSIVVTRGRPIVLTASVLIASVLIASIH